MTTNQLHGKKFEDFIKSCGLFSGSADASRSIIAVFDIESRFDKHHKLPTSIKTTGGNTVTLADARRFWSMHQPFRMIIGQYHQIESKKVFANVYEFLISQEILLTLKGKITLKEITTIHDGIGSFSKGQHVEARIWAQCEIEKIKHKLGHIILNPKIDSKTQRRLQCSVPLNALQTLCTKGKDYFHHQDAIGDFDLPITINSTKREFN